APPQHLAEVHLPGHHDGLAALAGPVERRLQAVGEARVDGDRVLQRPGRDADLADGPAGIDAPAVLHVDRVVVGLALVLGGERPVLALERERVVGPRGLDDGHALLEQLAVGAVLVGAAVPRTGGLGAADGGVVLEPARLVAAHEGHVEPPAEQVVEGGGVLGHPQRVVRRQHVAELVDAQARPVLAEEHRHQPGILAQLEAFHLEAVLGDADARTARLVAGAGVLGDLVEHALVEHGVLAGHAALELVAAADGHVHERVKVHHATPSLWDSPSATRLSSRARASTPISRTCSVTPTTTTTWLTAPAAPRTGAAITVTPRM